MINVASFEKKCMDLFGECPLNIQDITSGNLFGYSEVDLLYEAARKYYVKQRNNFSQALYDWKDGHKLEITHEQAKQMNKHYKNAQYIVDLRVDTSADSIVNWLYFPDDDPTICYYLGVSLDSPLILWARNYKKR